MTRRARTLLDLAANLGWPWLVLSYGATPERLGPQIAPLVAMVPALLFAGWRRISGEKSPLSLLVIVSLSLTAITGFLPLSARWYALKEAVIPLGIAMLVIGSTRSGPGLVAGLLGELLDQRRLDAAVEARGTRAELDRRIARGTRRFGMVIGAGGLISGALASVMVHSTSGTTSFATEVGSYTAWSYALVNLPMLVGTVWALRDVLDAVESASGVSLESLTPTD